MSSAPDTATGVGVVGLGFMGRTHVNAYRDAATAGFANRLLAVADPDPARRRGESGPRGNLETDAPDERLFDPDTVRGYATPDELFADPNIELVSICTPTDSHVELAIRALAAGKSVLVEKPVALSVAEVRRLASAAATATGFCMPAMCIRFWPGWSWLRERVEDGSLGPVRSAVFRRLGTRPAWSAGFYEDTAKSGGALFDLHVHDADLVRHLFGSPAAVTSTGDANHVTTLYHFDEGPAHVVVEGAWDHTPGFSFAMGFVVIFEHATARYEFGRDPVMTLARDGAETALPLEPLTGYDGEIRHALSAVAARKAGTSFRRRADVEEAIGLTLLLEAERESLALGGLRVALDS